MDNKFLKTQIYQLVNNDAPQEAISETINRLRETYGYDEVGKAMREVISEYTGVTPAMKYSPRDMSEPTISGLNKTKEELKEILKDLYKSKKWHETRLEHAWNTGYTRSSGGIPEKLSPSGRNENIDRVLQDLFTVVQNIMSIKFQLGHKSRYF